jgi:type IV pilus assembly protein PilC
MIYPIAVIVIAGVVVGVILWKVIPTFAAMFQGLGAELPLPTRVVIFLSDNLVKYMPFVIPLLAGAGYAFRQYYKTDGGRHVVDAVVLKLPVLGMLMRKIAVARFTARTSGNAIIEDAIMSTRKSIERGETISAPLREQAVFPSMVTQMISVGEATGALDAMLAKIADFYEEEVDTAVAGMLTLLEPIMIAILGVVVGGIVIAMYMPIFDMISKLA